MNGAVPNNSAPGDIVDFRFNTPPIKQWLETDPNLGEERLLERLIAFSDESYAHRMSQVPPDAVVHTERWVLLQVLDQHWREHLGALEHLRQGIHLRGYAQKNPKQEYKREAFELFGNLVESVKLEVTRTLMTVDLKVREPEEVEKLQAPAVENVQYQHAGYEEALAGAETDGAPAQAGVAALIKTTL